ncbi:ATPase-like protein [Tolypothrix tenuis PCC 7101]|uniref:ATPase-like protein n=1 Tax=Tolypothrix tenuis PCC 7101 TaxID=231146 RepID=A0A1Z4N674_9CYAN|nr:AAA family ATPase [Aulosira sp. FACHB-113]BAZ01162.1 ATPase-like protein [Tolypothrix tenuis PCC 7101]BAZ74916.1 ATPase-like protein [Aulosira laxa NIES-50]
MNMQLRTAKINNFKSLGNVELDFRDLTILVGANSSGKSNSLEALRFLRSLLLAQSPPPIDFMDKILRLDTEQISYEIVVEDDTNNKVKYNIAIKLEENHPLISREYLIVNGIEVIDIINGEGTVNDEDGENSQKYISDSDGDGLALRTAGNYGNKPLTKKLASYIKDWKFYDIDPDSVRAYPDLIVSLSKNISKPRQVKNITPSLNPSASKAQEILEYWAINEKDKFHEISQELQNCLKISLNLVEEREPMITVLEEDGKEIPLSNMSDGTLRTIAYFILLYQSDIPTLIGIEEPERNFHPGLLKDVATIIKRLSKKTQVIFTTHSSQLLDCFSPEEISSEISVILLSKKGQLGTKACLLDKLVESRDDLLDWMTDFGLGSAIYHSHLIEEILAA